MSNMIFTKAINNIVIYNQDIKAKGLYWSIIHRLYKFSSIKKILLPAVNYFKPEYLEIEGNKFYIDKSDTAVSQELILSGKWEEYETHLFKKNIHRGNVVLDIGAHIGYYTLIAARKVGVKGKVYAFEPDPRNFALLKKNVQQNGYKNVVLVNKAVADKSGNLKLFLNRDNTGDHRIYNSFDKRESINITAITLDEYFKDKNKKVDVIKMDIQGSEVKALTGCKKLIKQNKKVKILTEFWPNGLKLSGSSAEKYINFLVKNNFTLLNINEEKKQIKKITKKELLSIDNSKIDNFRYLFCVKN